MEIEKCIENTACYKWPSSEENAPVILWIHGYTLSAEIWPVIWNYYPGATHIAAELPGHGYSGPLSDYNSLSDLTTNFILIADYFKVTHIIGISFGGILALQMVIQHPDKFSSLSLISSPLGGQMIDEEAMNINRKLIKLYHTKGYGPWLTELWIQSPPDIFTGLKKHNERFKAVKKVMEKHNWEELADNSFSYFTSTTQLVSGLRRISTTVFLYVGEEDLEYIKRCNELLFRRLKKCIRFYIPNCGHLPLLEEPDSLVKIIRKNIDTVEKKQV